MAKKFIFGNWKMSQSLLSVFEFFENWNPKPQDGAEVAIFPSFVHLQLSASKIKEHQRNLLFGAQDCSTEEKGAFTGEVSAWMIKEIGAKYVLIGHSERRLRVPETESSLRKKLEQAFKAGLIPVYCLGETEAE
ncbi:MAG: triosephosphate isomerase, partial [Bacteriovoracaceae bacterium]|nr:triosephosphate isomerase [Bacteriovoracaceae bacterium]